MATRMGLILIGIMFYAVFTVTASAGAATAADSNATLADIKGNVTDSLAEARQNATQNYTAIENATAKPIVESVMTASIFVTEHSMTFGHDHPLLAKANEMISPWVIVAGLLVYVHRIANKHWGH